MANTSYPTDLTDEQWLLVEKLLPPVRKGCRPREVSLRDVLNAIFYLLRTACQWRMLPKDMPKWFTVYHYFAAWRDDGGLPPNCGPRLC